MTDTPTKPPRSEAGFTFIEIMMALAILLLGMTTIFALFPQAIRMGQRTIERSTSILIAESVEQAVREGLANRRGTSQDGRWNYFLFSHPGVTDRLPAKIEDANPEADYYILLPEDDADERRASRAAREDWYQRSKVFVYPESDGLEWEVTNEETGITREVSDLESGSQPNGRGDPLRADDDGDDREIEFNGETVQLAEVYRVYELGDSFFEFLRDGDEASFRDVTDDPISTYSFAFSIRRAESDASLMRDQPRDRTFVPANELFQVTVFIYRGFVARTNLALRPVYQSTFLVQK